MTKPQRRLLSFILSEGGDVSWYKLFRKFHPWTKSSVVAHGWVEIWNERYRDEVWGITDAGRAALARPE